MDVSGQRHAFKSILKPSLHRLIPFLSLILELQTLEVDQIPILAALDLPYIVSRRNPRKKQSSIVKERVYRFVD
jgi:hypothetical protein